MAKQPRNGTPAPDAGSPSLSQDLARLEEIVRRLESDDGDLDQALKLFEEGVGRLRQAREKLAAAETQVQKVLEEADGTLRMQPLDDDDL
ncbi:MAG TPA: exodeoxyribonuclease VII small subunit [Gemmatimonadales bacterium]|nr:exodeoxyribonuclease VII small subunit [Gemmatimonadales bacterium]